MRSESEANYAIEQYSDMVRRICFLYLKNRQDTEDIFQTVFLKYILYSGVFESKEHEKAWFARVAINASKDMLKSLLRKKTSPLEAISELAAENDDEKSEVLEAVLSLPKKYKDVLYLFYYEGYTVPEMAKILHKNENTLYSLLSRARTELRNILGDGA